MGIAYKQFLASDIIVTPFEVNKGFTFPFSQFESQSNGQLVGIDRFLGKSGSFQTNKTTTGTLSTQYQVLVFNSSKELYYSNFLTQSYGDPLARPVLIPGSDTEGNAFVGLKTSTGRYFNYLQSTLTASRYWPLATGSQLAVVSIPSKIFGEYIQPYSFVFDYSSSFKAYDDGEGNLYSSASFNWTGSTGVYSQTVIASAASIVNLGEISFSSAITLPSGYTFISASWAGGDADSPFFDSAAGGFVSIISASQGVSVGANKITSDQISVTFQDNTTTFPANIYLHFESGSVSIISGSISANQNVGNIIYTHGMAIFTNQNLPLSDMTTLANVTCSFSSSMTIYETQYKCTLRESEFNFSLNPSLLSGSTDDTVYGYVTGSYFSPYVTTVGLYDEMQNLLAVGKLAQPLPTTATTDTTILINLDR